MKANQATVELVKEFEGYRSEAYRDSVGVWTIGYGTTAAADVGITPRPGMVITKAEAEWYLQKALDKFAAQIEPYITAPITSNEFGAFLSLAYNIGPGAFRKSSALRYFNAGDKARAARCILLFNKAGGKVLPGLVRRREAEKGLFLATQPRVRDVALTVPGQDRPNVKPIAYVIGLIGAALAYWWATLTGKLCAVPLTAWVLSNCGG